MSSLKTRIVSVLLLCCLLSALMVFYFVLFFDDFQSESKPSSSLIIVSFAEMRPKNASKDDISLRIAAKIEAKLPLPALNTSSEALALLRALQLDLNAEQPPVADVWSLAHSWVTARQLLPPKAPQLSLVLRTLKTSRVLRADVSRTGTQLKLLLELDGQQRALFKPQRYSRQHVVSGDPYAGADRHNGEIVAFHLSRLLDLRVVPIVVSRRLRLSELRAVSSAALSATFTNDSCFYGECHYCSSFDSVCGDLEGRLEGSLHLMLPTKYKLQRVRNPWQRTYRPGVFAPWEREMDFCAAVLQRIPLRPRLLDIVDLAVFDFLIANADRHHFEVFKDVPNSALLFIDNGKSFGDPHSHELSILAPLSQCCVIRNSTYRRLQVLASAPLSAAVESLLAADDSPEPLLTRNHLSALDVRLRSVLALIGACLEEKGKQHVLK